ncbi:hypothetical protein BDN67DRAFT_961979 [Paxillus ammoniavirescens]|nr:hypothetical protein BDN67DRAFT_961979 [Paxillus ammoniavirescens]
MSAEEQPCKDEQSPPSRPLRRKKSSFDLRDVFQHHQKEVEGIPEVTTSLHEAENPKRSSLADESPRDAKKNTTNTSMQQSTGR